MQARREVVQVLLALTIISTVAAVISALSAFGILPRRRTQHQAPVIVVNVIKVEPPPHVGRIDRGHLPGR